VILRNAWPLLALSTIAIGAVAGSIPIIALGVLIGAVCYGATLWARFSLRRVTYERIIPEDHVFPGERIELRLRLTNQKPLPLTWAEVYERFSAGLIVDDEGSRTPGAEGASVLEWRTSLGSHQRVTRAYEMHAGDRGVYTIGGARLRSGDPLGLFESESSEERHRRVVIYPRTAPLGDLALSPRHPYGEDAGGSRIYEDPSRILGLRDYMPGDSLRRIDWNATARLGRLQSRIYDPSSSRHLLICLNTQTTTPLWAGVVTELLERSITVAASVARDAYDKRHSVGLIATSSLPDADRAVRVAPGRRPEQFIRILEALAVITPFVLEPLAAMLDREEHRVVAGTTLVVVTAIMTEELAATLLRLRRRRHAVVVLSTSGDTWPDRLDDIEVRDLSAIDVARRAAGAAP